MAVAGRAGIGLAASRLVKRLAQAVERRHPRVESQLRFALGTNRKGALVAFAAPRLNNEEGGQRRRNARIMDLY
jgi:hypothetical protein